MEIERSGHVYEARVSQTEWDVNIVNVVLPFDSLSSEAKPGETVKTGPGLWALWKIGKAQAAWKSPGAEEIPSSR